jgi:hypothetical protein
MRRARSLLPWLVTLVALAVAAASLAPAVAAGLTKAEKSQVKKIAAKQAAKAIKKRAASLTVGNAAQAGHATTATTATTADQAEIGLSPVAWAVVDTNGTLVSARGLTQDQVTKREIAGYCFDAPFAFKTVQTTPVHTGLNSTVSAKVGIRGVIGIVQECQAHEEVEVATTVDGAFVAGPFIIWFYN